MHNSHAKPLSAKGSYESMAVDSVAALNNKNGSSLQAIRNYISQNWNVSNMHAASYNKKTIDGLNLAVANQRLERVKVHTYKLTGEEKNYRRNREREKERRAIAEVNGVLPRGSGGSSKPRPAVDWSGYDLNVSGTVVEHNRTLREALMAARSRRDAHLKTQMAVLEPFFPENNYFRRQVSDLFFKRIPQAVGV